MFTVSPGVNVSEVDLTTGVTSVSTTQTAIAGVFRWGPVGKRFQVTSEPELVTKTAKPTNYNAETWFTAASFLAYGQSLIISRVSDGAAAMAVFANTVAPQANTQTVLNDDAYANVVFSANVAYVARYPGDLGNTLRVSQCDSANAFNSTLSLIPNSAISATSNVSISVGSSQAVVSIGFSNTGTSNTANAAAYAVQSQLQVGDQIKVGNNTVGTQYLKISSISGVTGNSSVFTFNINFASPYRLYANWTSPFVDRWWEFYNLVDSAPGTSDYVSGFGNTAAADEIHVVIVDDGGKFSGTPGTILETYPAASRATDAKTVDGSSNYYKTVINSGSKYVWFANDRAGAASATAAAITSAGTTTSMSIRFANGSDGSDETAISLAKLAQGYDLFKSADEVDVSLVLGGKSRQTDGSTLQNYIIDNVTESRKDCVSFISPPKEAVVNNVGYEVDSILGFANQIRGSSYAFVDSGYKYMYDKYNDVYRWIPLNGDIAGLAVRTDSTNDAWWSFAGLNRGQIKNIVKLAFNPNQAQRDILYPASVNPVCTQAGVGPVLFGDKTHLGTNSAFSRINVRRLFIVLEKSIAKDSKNTLFEFNDEFTRAAFRSRVTPYLRDIQGRRGITDFQVICDDTNNTAEVIDNEEFVGDIYIKPNRSINSIQLNFVAVRSGVQFSEIVGSF